MASLRIPISIASHVNCTSWPFLEPDSDITGIGVVVSFFFAAYLTLLLAIVQFLLPPQRSQVPLDQVLRESVIPQRFKTDRVELFKKLTRVVESAILLISDIQLITSLAILISGYVQLAQGISLYQWSTIVDLAWFSALTHLATLTSLRHFFRRRPIMATSRVLVMGLVLVLLSVAFVPTGYLGQRFNIPQGSDSLSEPRSDPVLYYISVPALCLYSTSATQSALRGFDMTVSRPGEEWDSSITNSFNVGLVGLSIVFLVISYIIRVIRLYAHLSYTFEKWLKVVPLSFLRRRYAIAADKRPLSKRRWMNNIHRATLLITITLAEAFYEIGDSMLWEILWLSAAVAWGTLRFVGLRRNSSLVGEPTWTFGQVLALSLCVLPLWDFLNTFFEPKQVSSLPTATHVTSPARPDHQNLSTLEDVKKTTWFRSLTFLILGMAAVYAAATLLDLPGAALVDWSLGLGIFANGQDVALTLLAYVMNLAFTLMILIVFVSACLADHFWRKTYITDSHSIRRQSRIARSHDRRRLRTSAWCLLILVLLALQAGFGIVLFINPGYFLWSVISRIS